MTSLTVIYCFFNAFFNADLVKAASKIPTPYSWSRIGAGSLRTIWDSVGLVLFLFDCQRFIFPQHVAVSIVSKDIQFGKFLTY